jgi:hypothetical protein
MMDLLVVEKSRLSEPTLSNPITRMNPFGSPRHHPHAASVHRLPREQAIACAAQQPIRRDHPAKAAWLQLLIGRHIGYAEFTCAKANFIRRLYKMNFFSSSRKVFAPL